jgi:hypothetical protein
MKSIRTCLLALPLALFACTSMPHSDDAVGPVDLSHVSWLAGDWVAHTADGRMEEMWSMPSGNSMMGMSRMTDSDTTHFFEYLRLVHDGGNLVMISQPNGKAETRFSLKGRQWRAATFENPGHDFPRTVTYTMHGDDRMTVTLVGTKDGREVTEEFEMHRRG